MNGGWLSFSGELGKGGWGRSRMRDILPVECLNPDDLVESTAGYPVRCAARRRSLKSKTSAPGFHFSPIARLREDG